MYYYIYDQFLTNKKYDKLLAQIESKITDLGIKDRIIKISILKSVSELVTDALRKGAHTIVVAGNDQTVNQIVNMIVGHDVVLGIIPVDKNNSIANFLGIHDPLEACETVSARKIETINLGEVGGEYFINKIHATGKDIRFECDSKFVVSTNSDNDVVNVYNFAPENDVNFKSKKFFNPQDNFLELVIEPQNDKKYINNLLRSLSKKPNLQPTKSVFRVRKLKIKQPVGGSRDAGCVMVDNFKATRLPLDVKVSNQKLKVIVGKDRKF